MNYMQLLSYTQTKLALTLGILCVFGLSNSLQSQNSKSDREKLARQEMTGDLEKPAERNDIVTGPAYRAEGSNYFTTQVNITENGENILLDAANEPSIAVDPNNPDRMMIGWRQFGTVFSSFRQAGYAYTLDGGETWVAPEPIDADVFRSDPVLEVDNNGVFYYNSLTYDGFSDFTIDVYRTTETGVEWDEGVYAYGGDKQWMAIDNTNGSGEGHIYTNWNEGFSVCSPGSFVRSTDGGESYEECVAVPGDPFWGTVAVGPDGELYTVGRSDFNKIIVLKSNTAQHADSSVSWFDEMEIDLDGKLAYGYEVNPAGLIGQAWIDVDRSGGPGHGNIYVLASVDRTPNGTQVDVMFTRSTNGGLSWDGPKKINDDFMIDDYQWFGTMSVAPNGRIDAVWLDTRDAFQLSISSALYYSYSEDQGVTWSENERLSELFDPRLGWPQQEKMGDYFDMVSDNEGAHLAWANTLNGEQDVYYTRIIPEPVGTKEPKHTEDLASLKAYPNPFGSHTKVSFTLEKEAKVELAIYDVYGKLVRTLMDTRKAAGNYEITLDGSELSGAVYLCKLQIGTDVRTIRLMHIK